MPPFLWYYSSSGKSFFYLILSSSILLFFVVERVVCAWSTIIVIPFFILQFSYNPIWDRGTPWAYNIQLSTLSTFSTFFYQSKRIIPAV